MKTTIEFMLKGKAEIRNIELRNFENNE